ncbi:hypothetical protein [Chryseobacterium sp.]|uniref:hypothetical protein n=1 Tax=Chryseobacterium sp. TaxID=1871047 RepID=UPI0028A1AF4E|nr:hypothetical protein [Chryseobacterium sp.]
MKKEILIEALGLASVFAMTSATDEIAENGRRPMFGKISEGLSNCNPTDMLPNGQQKCSCTEHYTQYVFWIGFKGTREVNDVACGLNPIPPLEW